MSIENSILSFEGEAEVTEKIERKIREWLKAPVFLASSSESRRRGLEAVGFAREKIIACAVPDEIETTAIDSYDRMMLDPRGSGATSEVARVKAEFLLKDSRLKIPSKAFIFSADTMPLSYKRIHDFGIEQPPADFYWLAESMRKPKNKAEARKMIIALFSRIAENYQEGLNSDLDIGVKVKTSVSVRFPNEKDIQTEAYAVVLIPQRILSIIDSGGKDIHSELEKITDEILDIMDKEGNDVTKISGGINYALQGIKEALKINEKAFLNEKLEPGIYLGLPEANLRRLLEEHAIKTIK